MKIFNFFKMCAQPIECTADTNATPQAEKSETYDQTDNDQETVKNQTNDKD